MRRALVPDLEPDIPTLTGGSCSPHADLGNRDRLSQSQFSQLRETKRRTPVRRAVRCCPNQLLFLGLFRHVLVEFHWLG
jgi:hypothetical protein